MAAADVSIVFLLFFPVQVFLASSASSGIEQKDTPTRRSAVVSVPQEVSASTTGSGAYTTANIRDAMEDIFRIVSRKALPYVQELAYDENLPTECLSSLFKVATGLRSYKLWAFKCELLTFRLLVTLYLLITTGTRNRDICKYNDRNTEGGGAEHH